MGEWVVQTHRRAAVFHDQIAAARKLQAETGVDTSELVEGYFARVQELYEDEFPLSSLMDKSDLILHAEGPSAIGHSPKLHAFNWLCTEAERQLRGLARAIFDLSEKDAMRLARDIDLRLSGLAPGSLYAGFQLIPPSDDILKQGNGEPVFVAIKEAISALPGIPDYIGDESLNTEIYAFLPDPALRDAGLSAALHLSPTGRMGIHTLGISAPGKPMATLSQRERVVLREALKRPELANRKRGTFIGDVRVVDLDANRFHIRNVKGVGSLRCVLSEFHTEEARHLIGSQVKVSGEYESNKSGQPRLMLVDQIEHIDQPEQSEIDTHLT